jgi:hypothetical protein
MNSLLTVQINVGKIIIENNKFFTVQKEDRTSSSQTVKRRIKYTKVSIQTVLYKR